jgi:hypothetical protein
MLNLHHPEKHFSKFHYFASFFLFSFGKCSTSLFFREKNIWQYWEKIIQFKKENNLTRLLNNFLIHRFSIKNKTKSSCNKIKYLYLTQNQNILFF